MEGADRRSIDTGHTAHSLEVAPPFLGVMGRNGESLLCLDLHFSLLFSSRFSVLQPLSRVLYRRPTY